MKVLNKIKAKQFELIKKYGRSQKASKNNSIVETYKTLTVDERRALLNIKDGISIPMTLTKNQINTISTQVHRHT